MVPTLSVSTNFVLFPEHTLPLDAIVPVTTAEAILITTGLVVEEQAPLVSSTLYEYDLEKESQNNQKKPAPFRAGFYYQILVFLIWKSTVLWSL